MMGFVNDRKTKTHHRGTEDTDRFFLCIEWDILLHVLRMNFV